MSSLTSVNLNDNQNFDNFDKLIYTNTPLKKRHVFSEPSLKAIHSIQSNKPGCTHTCKKMTAVVLYYPTMVATLGAAAYLSVTRGLPLLGNTLLESITDLSTKGALGAIGTVGLAATAIPTLAVKASVYVFSLEIFNGRKMVSKYFDRIAESKEEENKVVLNM